MEQRGAYDLTAIDRVDPMSRDEWPRILTCFKNGKRLILSCDGGGVRGIITLQCLKALEQHLSSDGVPVRCIDIFDMFAGTSTGAVIAVGLALGISTDGLIDLYRAYHRDIFTPNWPQGVVPFLCGVLAGLLMLATGLPFCIPLIAGVLTGLLVWWGVDKLLIPKYNSATLRNILYTIACDEKLSDCKRDILITATDTVRCETIYFSAFHTNLVREGPDDTSAGPGIDWSEPVRGTYRDVLVRDAVLASGGSAPTYFAPVGRFVDGGVGSYNNPAYVAAVEALRYSAHPVETHRSDNQGGRSCVGEFVEYRYPMEDQLYKPGKTLMLSFGTGNAPGSFEAGDAQKKKLSVGWIEWILNAFGTMAAVQQSYVVERELDRAENAVEFRRFNLYFNKESVERLAAYFAKHDCPTLVAALQKKVNYRELTLDAVRHFGFLDAIGQLFGKYLTLECAFEDSIVCGDPVKTNPGKFHINVYKREVLKEFEQENERLGRSPDS